MAQRSQRGQHIVGAGARAAIVGQPAGLQASAPGAAVRRDLPRQAPRELVAVGVGASLVHALCGDLEAQGVVPAEAVPTRGEAGRQIAARLGVAGVARRAAEAEAIVAADAGVVEAQGDGVLAAPTPALGGREDAGEDARGAVGIVEVSVVARRFAAGLGEAAGGDGLALDVAGQGGRRCARARGVAVRGRRYTLAPRDLAGTDELGVAVGGATLRGDPAGRERVAMRGAGGRGIRRLQALRQLDTVARDAAGEPGPLPLRVVGVTALERYVAALQAAAAVLSVGELLAEVHRLAQLDAAGAPRPAATLEAPLEGLEGVSRALRVEAVDHALGHVGLSGELVPDRIARDLELEPALPPETTEGLEVGGGSGRVVLGVEARIDGDAVVRGTAHALRSLLGAPPAQRVTCNLLFQALREAALLEHDVARDGALAATGAAGVDLLAEAALEARGIARPPVALTAGGVAVLVAGALGGAVEGDLDAALVRARADLVARERWRHRQAAELEQSALLHADTLEEGLRWAIEGGLLTHGLAGVGPAEELVYPSAALVARAGASAVVDWHGPREGVRLGVRRRTHVPFTLTFTFAFAFAFAFALAAIGRAAVQDDHDRVGIIRRRRVVHTGGREQADHRPPMSAHLPLQGAASSAMCPIGGGQVEGILRRCRRRHVRCGPSGAS